MPAPKTAKERKFKMKRAIILIIAFAMLLSACTANAQTAETEAAEVESNVVTIEDIESAERGKEKARLIAQYATQESDGLIFVNYSDIPSHGVSQQTGSEFFGVHYSMVILKHSEEFTPQDADTAKQLAGMIFKLTAQHLLRGTPAITHMGVQIVNPDAWFWQGQDAHLYIATSKDLLGLPDTASLDSWFAAANDTPILLITEDQLRQLLEQLEEK